ncbi:hypothetical protein CY34DRAFT_151008 [Suillus luteus UH-Slu-Lm8-n1]|uniref:Uncharacterized protein n=1 Tax=Suillus luteus UH-Slu-Lm8-n1 TaxID=930992 RepID=A0A0D0B1X4_9AGAM|nr:hypothetical protein CY34DRAFT_151008 [Suillus luteus UH-Slu-Lm8-n1]
MHNSKHQVDEFSNNLLMLNNLWLKVKKNTVCHRPRSGAHRHAVISAYLKNGELVSTPCACSIGAPVRLDFGERSDFQLVVTQRRLNSIISHRRPSPLLLEEASEQFLLPQGASLSVYPIPHYCVSFKVTIPVSILLLQYFEERVTTGSVHTDGLYGMVAARTMTRQAFFEKCLFICATTC